jgi:ATP-dependent HslUV protease subunit HslV
MSIAVAVRKNGRTVVASDSQESFGDRKATHGVNTLKVLKTGQSLVAFTGWGVYEQLLVDYLSRHSPRLGGKAAIFAFFVRFWKQLRTRYQYVEDQADEANKTPFASLDSTFLIVNREGIFYVSGNMSVTQFDHYYAIGSGADYALGALHALESLEDDPEVLARKACAAAIEFNVYCGGDVVVHSFSNGTKRRRKS